MTPDHAEIARLVDWAEASHIRGDGEWDQFEWGRPTTCGTACCIAGKWALDHGWTLIDYFGAWAWLDPRGLRWSHPGDHAAAALGLDAHQADSLFNGDNTIDDLRRIAKEIRTEAGQ